MAEEEVQADTVSTDNNNDTNVNNNDDNEIESKEESKEQPLNSNSDDTITVVITGASGFIASHMIKQLLESKTHKYNVIGTIRGDPNNPKDLQRYQWILDINTTGDKSRLKLYQANLLSSGAYDDCIINTNADYVFHVASPFILDPKDIMKDLVSPAIDGTLNVLESCKKSYIKNNGNLKKVIITSSMAAITDSPNKKYTENDWNKLSTINRNAYYYSKCEAEKAAWRWMYNNSKKGILNNENWIQLKEVENEIKTNNINDKDGTYQAVVLEDEETDESNKVGFNLCTCNPWFVVGAEMKPSKKLNESNEVFARLINGDFPIKMNFTFPFVDVKDVARCHILMIENNTSNGRYIICAETWTFDKLRNYLDEICKSENINEKLPSCDCSANCCACIVWCASYGENKGTGDYLRTNVNKIANFDNSRILNLGKPLGFQFKPIDLCIKDTVIWQVNNGFIN